MSALPPVATLVPHAPPMLLLDALVVSDAQHTIAMASVRPDHPLLRAGAVPALAALEWIAQTAAARRGLELRGRADDPRVGFVVGSPRLELFVESVAVGASVRIEVRPVGEEVDVGLRGVEGEVWADDVLVARGAVQVIERRAGVEA